MSNGKAMTIRGIVDLIKTTSSQYFPKPYRSFSI